MFSFLIVVLIVALLYHTAVISCLCLRRDKHNASSYSLETTRDSKSGGEGYGCVQGLQFSLNMNKIQLHPFNIVVNGMEVRILV